MTDYRDYQNPNRIKDPVDAYTPSTGIGGMGILLALGVILLFIIGIAMFGTGGSPTSGTADPTAAPAPVEEPALPVEPATPAPAPAPSQ
jgi:hypothetical protein